MPLGYTAGVNGNFLLVELFNLALRNAYEYSALPIRDKCDTTNITNYDYTSIENHVIDNRFDLFVLVIC